MKYRIIIFVAFCTALLIAGCGNKEPVAPESIELAVNEQDAFLAKKHHCKKIPWQGVETSCESIPGEEWYEGSVMHRVGWKSIDILESDNPLINGVNTVTYSIELDLATGEGRMYDIQWSVKPYAYKGTWEGTSTGTFTNYLVSWEGEGFGTGKLKGMSVTVKGIQRSEVQNPPCGTAINQYDDSGYIFMKKKKRKRH